MLKNMR